MILEPCCFRKQLGSLLSSMEEEGGASHLFTWGDFGLPELLDYLAGTAPGCDVLLSLVHVESATLSAIASLMERKDNGGEFLVRSFTLVSQGGERKEIISALGGYRAGGRMTVCEEKVSFRCMAVGNGERHYVLGGSINQSPVFSMQMMTLTSSRKLYEEVVNMFGYQKKRKSII